MSSPTDDFYHAVNGDWLKKTFVPDDMSRVSEFDVLQQANLQRIKSMIAEGLGKSQDLNNLAAFIAAGMDPARKEQGAEVLLPYFSMIASSPLSVALAKLSIIGLHGLFHLSVDERLSDNRVFLINIDQPSLGLPDKRYYVDAKFADTRAKYKEFIQATCSVLSRVNIFVDPQSVYALEQALAQHLLTPDELRNIREVQTEMPFDKVVALLSRLDMRSFVDELKRASATLASFENQGLLKTVAVNNVGYFLGLNEVLATMDVKPYLMWKVFVSSMGYLNEDLEQMRFDFYGTHLSGIARMKPLEERVIATASNLMGDVLGQAYGRRYFPAESRRYIEDMVENIKAALADKIRVLDWMTPVTKREALSKLRGMRAKIGYPEKIRDYSKLRLSGTYFQQSRMLAFHHLQLSLRKLKEGKDKDMWEIGAHEVNAYYSPIRNEIVFPAGILQSPFFDPTHSTARNYGAIGCVIGHEICHGFDDQGRLFDEKGNMRNWWTDSDTEEYNKRSDVVKRQYDRLTIAGHKLNGDLTLGENIADICGVIQSLNGLKLAYRRQNKPFTYADRAEFFRTYARLWRQVVREEELVKRLSNDPHAPGVFRVNQVLRNVGEFHEAFRIRSDNNMYMAPCERVRLW
jgi:putative endopeptidase